MMLEKKKQILYPLAMLPIILIGWEIASSINQEFLPGPLTVARAFSILSQRTTGYGTGGLVLDAVVTTLRSFAIGFVLSVIVGLGLGLALGNSRTVGTWFDPYITLFYATPRIVFIPLIVVWFGIGETGRIVVVFLSAVFPIILNTVSGVRNLDRTFLETARSFMLTRVQVLSKIVLPGSLAFMVSGIRIGVARSLTGVLTAEMFLIAVGMGGAIRVFTNQMELDKVFVFVFIVAFLGIVLTELVKSVEKHYAKWRV